MASQQINIGMDMSQVKSATAEFLASLNDQENAVYKLFQQMAELNKTNDVTKVTLAGISEEGTKVEAVLKKVASGWDIVGSKVKFATDQLEKLRAAQEAAAKAQAASARSSAAEGTLNSTFNLGNQNLGMSQANSVDTAVQRIKATLADGQVSVERFQELLAQFQANPRGIMPNLTSDEAKIVRSFRSIQAAIEATSKANDKAADDSIRSGQRAADAARAQGQAAVTKSYNQYNLSQGNDFIKTLDFSKVDPGRLTQVEAALARIRSMLESGAISFARFKELYDQVANNPKSVIPNLNGNEQKAVGVIRDLGKELDGVKNKADETQKIFISLGGVLRLLEAQVLKRIFSTLEAEIMGSVSAASKFSIQIAEIQTISQDAQLTTKRWSDGVLELSNRFGNNNADVAEAAYQAISNQVAKGADSFKFLDAALGFGMATVTSAADSVNLLSGALRSFQLPATDAERVSSILFKTIELGRVRGKEMADTFGRVGVIAKEAGVKLEETGAAIAVLTDRGIKFSDASTLIQNILLKMIKPTDEMKKLFVEWGVASGPAALATFGFVGVLQKLDVEAQKGTSRIGELAGQIRAIRSLVGLTGGAFNEFNTALGKISNAGPEFEEAKARVANSPGKRAEIQFTQLRNFFQQDFGEPFLKGLLVISDALGGIVNILKISIVAVQGLTMGYIAFKLVQIANLPVMATTITLTTVQTAANAASTVSFYNMAAAAGTFLATIAPYAAVAAAAFVAGQYFFGNTAAGYDSIIAKAREYAAEATKAREGLRKGEEAGDDATRDRATKSQSAAYAGILQVSTAVAKKATELKELAISNFKGTTEALKVTAGTYFDNLRTRMKQYSDAISEAKSLTKASLKETEDLPRRGGQAIFNEKMKYASGGIQDSGTGYVFGDQKSDLVRSRIVELTNRAREEFSKGTAESVGEARKLFNDVERLQSQLFDLETNKQKQLFDFQVKNGQVAPSGYDSRGKAYYEFTAKTSEIEKTINKLTEERLALEEKFRAQQELRKKAAEEDQSRERERLRALQQQFGLLEKLEAFGKDGKVKTEFKGPEGMQKLLGEFDERRAKIQELAGGDSAQGLEVFRDLGKQRAALIQQVLQAMRSEAVNQVQEGATRDQQNAERLGNKLREQITQFRNDADRLQDPLSRQIGVSAQVLKPFKGGGFSPDQKYFDAEPKRQEGLAALKEVRDAKDAFNASGGRTEENALRLKTAIDSLNKSMLDYMKLRGMNPENTAILTDKSNTTIGDQARRSGSIGDQILEAGRGISTATGQLTAAENSGKEMLEKFKAMPGALQAMKEAALLNGPITEATFESLKVKASGYADQLERINRALAQQKLELPGKKRTEVPAEADPNKNVDPEGLMFGGQPKYMSMGGAAGWAPRGSDRVPAMLGEDETVMTGAATRQFAPLLKAMNSGTMPRYMANGGPVTNVGDINVNVSGGQTDAQTIRNIAAGLRRGISRGEISLNK